MNLTHVIEELVEDRGLGRETLESIVKEGMLAAYQKKYPDFTFRLETDKKTGDLLVDIEKAVVVQVEDEDTQISLRKAHHINKKLVLGDKVWVLFEGKIGRVEVLKAKQVIASRIREIEALSLYNEFKDKVNTIIHGTIHKIERGGLVIKLANAYAFLPHSLTSPLDKYVVGYPVRALLKEVLPEPRNENQLILDRASVDFFTRLFEIEIPEVFEHLVEVKRVARVVGYKTKVVVSSNDPNIDPVGTCVGVHGARIKPILKELGGEKIDILPYKSLLEDQIRLALKPAEINRIELTRDGQARVWLDEDQRSLAIGKKGQNILLASELTGVNIHLVQHDFEAVKNNSSFKD
ncbi:MAG TPA: transcription termination factor NusA [Candidatus Babeliales bacterium]|nr:transcription termination factor NusA [Candidatus Babeliales bacterium]